MTSNSKIVKAICEFGPDWESQFAICYPNIIVNRDGPLAIFNYGIGANFKDPLVQEARGIIINTETKEVVCWPFTKFGKYDEPDAPDIDWKSARVQEKLDGSIIKLWFNQLTNEWQFSTNSVIDAKNSDTPFDVYTDYMDLIAKAKNYNDIPFDKLSKDITYIFELVGPSNRVVIEYPDSRLYHIGSRNNVTGDELILDIGIQKPKEYDLHNLTDCINEVNLVLNYNTDVIGRCSNEGFVVVDKYFNRIKIKSQIYSSLHNLKAGSKKSVKMLLWLLYRNRINVSELSMNHPDVAHIIKYYDFKLTEFMYCANYTINATRRLYSIHGDDRKTLAAEIQKLPLPYIGFLTLDHKYNTNEYIISLLSTDKIFFRIGKYSYHESC